MRLFALINLACLLLTGCGPKEASEKLLGAWLDTLSNEELYIIRQDKDILVCFKEGHEVRKVTALVTNGHGLEFAKFGKRQSVLYSDSTDHISVLGVEYRRIEPDRNDSLYPQARELSAKLVTCLAAAMKAGSKSKQDIEKVAECKIYLEAMHAMQSSFKPDSNERFPRERMKRVYQTQEIIGLMQQIMKNEHTALYVYGLEVWE